jgi:hypothetical protein
MEPANGRFAKGYMSQNLHITGSYSCNRSQNRGVHASLT